MGKKARDRNLDIKGQCNKTTFNIALVKVKVTQSCDSLRPQGLSWSSPGQNTGVGSLSLLERIFTTQVSNPGLLHCRWILYRLSQQESPRILELPLIPSSGYLPDLGIKPESTALQVNSLPAELPGKPDPPGGASGK